MITYFLKVDVTAPVVSTKFTGLIPDTEYTVHIFAIVDGRNVGEADLGGKTGKEKSCIICRKINSMKQKWTISNLILWYSYVFPNVFLQ